MYQLVLLAIISMAVGATSEAMASCARLQHGVFECCKKQGPSLRIPEDSYREECAVISERPTPCDVELCVSKKRGLILNNGAFDKEKMTEDVEANFENDPGLVNNLKENCINGNISKYGPPDLCDLLKQRLCFEVNVIKSCDQWNDVGHCKGMQSLAIRCVRLFD